MSEVVLPRTANRHKSLTAAVVRRDLARRCPALDARPRADLASFCQAYFLIFSVSVVDTLTA
jgi:hypothetical protein